MYSKKGCQSSAPSTRTRTTHLSLISGNVLFKVPTLLAPMITHRILIDTRTQYSRESSSCTFGQQLPSYNLNLSRSLALGSFLYCLCWCTRCELKTKWLQEQPEVSLCVVRGGPCPCLSRIQCAPTHSPVCVMMLFVIVSWQDTQALSIMISTPFECLHFHQPRQFDRFFLFQK